MPNKLVIIPCGASKLPTAAAAAELYTGSMFKDALRTALSMTSEDNIRIMSAKHGLLKLDQIVEPYELKMGQPGSVSLDALRYQLRDLYESHYLHEYDIHTLLPRAYYETLWAAVHTMNRTSCYAIVNQYNGCAGIGYQKAKLRKLREATKASIS